MNNNRNYELQCLLELLAAVLDDEGIPVWKKLPDWSKLYKMADYHHVANVLYGPMISMDRRRMAKWQDNVEERFHYAVMMQERYRGLKQEFFSIMEKEGIHCMELEETVLSGCYKKREQRYPLPLTFLVEEGKSEALKIAMEKGGFEEKTIKGKKPLEGEHWFRKPGGAHIILYEKLVFTNKKMNKYFAVPVKNFQKKKGFHYIHAQDINDFYLYYAALLAEKYARGSVEIRDILDLWQYYLLCYERMDWKDVNKELKRMEIDRFGEMIVKLAAMWFGHVETGLEELELLQAMEEYIVSKGTRARKENEQLLPLVKEVADVYERDLKRERRKKILELWFPEQEYMETIYPVLKKRKILLPFCWIARLIQRQYKRVKYFFLRHYTSFRRNVLKKILKIRRKLRNLRKRFRKRKKSGEGEK